MLRVQNLKKYFETRRSSFSRNAPVKAVDGVTFQIDVGERLGLVGESGSGKTTVGRLVARLLEPTAGSIEFDGEDVTNLSEQELRRGFRTQVQMAFQDPVGSLNPRRKLFNAVAQPLRAGEMTKTEVRRRVFEVMEQVGLDADVAYAYPHELSAAQQQRAGVAAALAPKPRLIVADEAVSALDVTLQAMVLNLLMDVSDESGAAFLFISHDLNAVRHISNRVAVMYLGKIVEIGVTNSLFERPYHPYTISLLSAVPTTAVDAARDRIILTGEIPSPTDPPAACNFHTRCPIAVAPCGEITPVIESVDADAFREVSCHYSPKRQPTYLSTSQAEQIEASRNPTQLRWLERTRIPRKAGSV